MILAKYLISGILLFCYILAKLLYRYDFDPCFNFFAFDLIFFLFVSPTALVLKCKSYVFCFQEFALNFV